MVEGEHVGATGCDPGADEEGFQAWVEVLDAAAREDGDELDSYSGDDLDAVFVELRRLWVSGDRWLEPDEVRPLLFMPQREAARDRLVEHLAPVKADAVRTLGLDPDVAVRLQEDSAGVIFWTGGANGSSGFHSWGPGWEEVPAGPGLEWGSSPTWRRRRAKRSPSTCTRRTTSGRSARCTTEGCMRWPAQGRRCGSAPATAGTSSRRSASCLCSDHISSARPRGRAGRRAQRGRRDRARRRPRGRSPATG